MPVITHIERVSKPGRRVYVSAGERSSSELAARSVAVAATVVFLISGLSTPLLGALADHAGWDGLWLACAAIAAGGALLATRLTRTAIPAAPATPGPR